MKFHDLEQGSKEWLEFRRTHVGASDSPKILSGATERLIQEKVHGKSGYKSEAMQRGHDLEPVARGLFEEKMGVKFSPAVATHGAIPWFSASLDGICQEKKEIVEIKCCSSEIHEGAKRGEIPRDHLIQIQHQLAVTGYDTAYYCHFNGQEIAIVPVEHDQRLIATIVRACGTFYHELCEAYKNPKEEDLVPVFYHERGASLMRELVDIRSRKTPLCDREKQLREEILEIAPDHNFILEGVLVHRSKGRVTYDTDQMKLDGMDLKKYEKHGKISWTISNN